MTEKHSKIRIVNPEITQVSFDLSLVGRKFIPVQRLNSAISMKETDGKLTFGKILILKYRASEYQMPKIWINASPWIPSSLPVVIEEFSYPERCLILEE